LNWDTFVEVARRSRLLLPAAEALDTPAEVRARIERYRARTMAVNGANLSAVRMLTPRLAEAGVAAAIIKGPLAQHSMHGSYFLRPSTDVDILVDAGEFDAARDLIAAQGYELARACATPWWRLALGEQHLLPKDGGRVQVDLHHRVQQPGAPSPSLPRRLLAHTRSAQAGATSVEVLSPAHTTLLSAMSFVKAVSQRECAVAHAYDMAATVLGCTRDHLDETAEEARVLGLTNTMHAALRGATVLFGVRAHQLALGRALAFLRDEDLVRCALGGGTRPPQRTRLLWSLCDDPVQFGREFAWNLASSALLSLPAGLERANI
jgi:hypothetical protein